MKTAVALVVLLACAPVALGAGTPGVTAKTIVIGSSGPLTGEANGAGGILRGADAYFKWVNARGGVNGRRITFTYLDDADDPSQAVDNVRELIEQHQVFALFSIVGTSANLAIRDLTNLAKVPVVFSASGATTLGRDYARYPYTIGYPPPYVEEGAIYAKHVLAANPRRARIAVLYQADVSGRDLLAGLRKGLGARVGKLLVKAVGYDPAVSDVRMQVAALKATGANTFMVFTLGHVAVEAVDAAQKLRWKPQLYVNAVAAAPAVMRSMPWAEAGRAISIVFAKDPASPKWAKDPATKLAAQLVEKYVAGGSPTDGFLVAGMASAYSLVDALRHAGKNPTREGLMTAVTHMNEASNPFLLPGIKVRTTPTARFPITQVGLQRWQNGHWVLFGGLQTFPP
jgi:branched-chain amino acid transport system substrate-binding protein